MLSHSAHADAANRLHMPCCSVWCYELRGVWSLARVPWHGATLEQALGNRRKPRRRRMVRAVSGACGRCMAAARKGCSRDAAICVWASKASSGARSGWPCGSLRVMLGAHRPALGVKRMYEVFAGLFGVADCVEPVVAQRARMVARRYGRCRFAPHAVPCAGHGALPCVRRAHSAERGVLPQQPRILLRGACAAGQALGGRDTVAVAGKDSNKDLDKNSDKNDDTHTGR